MCSSYFPHRMESNYQGDLSDIFRPSSSTDNLAGDLPPALPGDGHVDWQFPATTDDFGDPFSNVTDPLLVQQHLIHLPTFFTAGTNSTEEEMIKTIKTTPTDQDTNGVGTTTDEMMMMMMKSRRRPCNLFSRMLQISPNTQLIPESPCGSPASSSSATAAVGVSPRGILSATPPPLVVGTHQDMSSKANCLMETTTGGGGGGVQISSPPRNTGIKRRKSQAKKVVCIPAPAPANSRASGEVVPSDLWAWRKYGQKPIKGSPYPRGYYRCSSSKGCSARKQVERSRTDPNMLVITYTSEHNHPWPTQRNALAGSTRSQPTKTNNNNNNAAAAAGTKSLSNFQAQKSFKEDEENDQINTDHHHDNISSIATSIGPSVKEEEMEELDHRHVDMEDNIDGTDHHQQLSTEVFPQSSSYRPTLPDSNHQQPDQDFFAELGEIEADPLNLLFTQGFPGGNDHRESSSKVVLDPFTLFDWTANNNNSNKSFGDQSKRDL